MGFRCELCDEWLPILQFSKLCDTCYKIRTIVKCYSAQEILTHLEKNFLVSSDRYVEQEQKDKKFFKQEERRLEEEFNKELKKLQEQQRQNEEEQPPPLITIKEEEEKEKPKVETRSKNKK